MDRGVVAGILVLAAMIIGIASTCYFNIRKIGHDGARTTRSREIVAAVDFIETTTRKLQATQRAYLVSGLESWLPAYRETKLELAEATARLKDLVRDDEEQQARAAAAEREAIAGVKALDKVVDLRRTEGFPAVEAMARANGPKSFVDPLLAVIRDARDVEQARLGDRERESAAAYWRAILYAVAGAVLGLLTLGMFDWLLGRSIRTRARFMASLAEQKELLDATLSSIGDGVIATDRTGNVSFLNGVAEKLTGWRRADAVGVPLEQVFRIVNETTRQPVENPALRALAEGVIVGLANHTVLLGRDGVERPIDDSAAPIRNQQGEVSGAVLVFRDISERRRAEDRVLELEERQEFVRRSSGVGFWYCDLPFDVLEWDVLVKEHFHLPPEAKVTIETFYERIHPDDRETTRLAIEKSINEHTGYDIVYRTFHPETGDLKYIRAIGRTRYAADGTPMRFDGVTLDVTAQKLADDERERLHREVDAERAVLMETFLRSPAFKAILRGPNHVFERANDHYYKLVGRRDILGKPLREALPEIESQGFIQLLDRVFETGEPYSATEVKVLIQSAPGGPMEERYVDFVYQSLRDSSGEVTGVLVHGVDLTARKRAEEEVRRKDERLQLLVDRSRDYAVLITDRNGRVVEWAGGAETITGFTPQEAVGGTADLIFTAEDRAAGVPERERLTAEREGRAEDKRWHVRKDGSVYFADGVMVALRDGDGLRGFGKVFRDVTDRKQAEDALREENRVVETLNAIGGKLAAELDLNRLLQMVTDEATQLAGAEFGAFFYNAVANGGEAYMLYTVSGAPIEAFSKFPYPRATEIFEPTFRGAGLVRLDDVTKDPRFGKNEPYFGMPQGHLPVRSYLAVPVKSRSGEVFGGLFMGHSTPGQFTDRHERLVAGVAATAAVAIDNARLYEQLRDQDKRKDEFLALLAHELRNPLAPLRNGLEVFRLADQKPEVVESRRMMDRQLSHMVRMIDDLLDISRINRNKLELRRTRASLAEIVSNAVETVRPAIDEGRHQLTVDLPEAPVLLDADVTRLQQVLGNLLSNSAKYTEPGGRIRLSAAVVGDEAVIEVSDNGIGIPPDFIPNLFDMFSQVDRSIDRRTSGLGIGLALVKGLVEMHGGTVAAASAGKDQGSTFTIRLPLPEEGSAPPATPVEERPSSAGRNERVMVVDDNRDSADSMAIVLRLFGYDVRTAYDGLDALEVAEDFRPQAVLMDIGMPRLNGYEAVRRLRENPWAAETIVIALTGWGQEVDRARSRDAGCDGHLVKPVDLAELESLLERLLREKTQPSL